MEEGLPDLVSDDESLPHLTPEGQDSDDEGLPSLVPEEESEEEGELGGDAGSPSYSPTAGALALDLDFGEPALAPIKVSWQGDGYELGPFRDHYVEGGQRCYTFDYSGSEGMSPDGDVYPEFMQGEDGSATG